MSGAIHACVEVGGQPVGVSSLLACGSWGSNSGHQVWWQANSPALDLVMLHRRQEDRLEVFSRKQVFCFSSEEKGDLAETFPKTPTRVHGFGQDRAELTVGRLPWGLLTTGYNNCTQWSIGPNMDPLRVGFKLESKS